MDSDEDEALSTLLSAGMALVNAVTHEPNKKSLINLANQIPLLLNVAKDEPDTKPLRELASGVASGVRGLLDEGKEKETVEELVDTLSRAVNAIEDDDDPDTRNFKKLATGIASGFRELINDERELESLGDLITQIEKSLMENVAVNEGEESSENTIKLLVWLPTKKSTGHFACDLYPYSDSTDGYVSFWPDADKSTYWRGIRECRKEMNTYEKDKRAEKDEEPRVFYLHSLDKEKMKQKLKEIKDGIEKGEVKYEATTPLLWNGEGKFNSNFLVETHNCCTVIWSILVAGGIHNLMEEKIFGVFSNVNPMSTLGKLFQLAGFIVPTKDTTANPLSIFNLLTMATYAEKRALNGLPRLTTTVQDEDDEDDE